MIHSTIETAMQIFIIVFAFQTDNGVRHVEQMFYAFTTEDKCEIFAKEVMADHHKRIPALYWWCESMPVNP